MTEVRKLWTAELPPLPEEDLARIGALCPGEYYQICACFWLFRYLHGFPLPRAVLLGDYCFGRFSHHLAALDDVALTNAFAAYLKNDTLNGSSLPAYLAFIRDASGAG